jgi:lipid II:glycine glycyltransferase (peptidoglycan interpeptide bridge formation enzyme)
VKIEIISEVSDQEWDELLLSSPTASVFHTTAWLKVLTKTFPHLREKFIVAVDSSHTLLAGMPFIIEERFHFQRIFSLPFGTYGGVIKRPEVTQGVVEEIIRKFLTLGLSWRVLRLEIVDFGRELTPPPHFTSENLTTLILSVNSSREALWQGFSSDTRGKTRQAIKRGVKIREVTSDETVRECFQMLVETDQRHGYKKPLYPLSLLFSILEYMKPRGFLYWTIAEYQGKGIAHLLSFKFKDVLFLWLAGSYQAYHYLRANNLLYWDAIEEACQSKLKKVNLSATSPRQAGLWRFKTGFGAKPLTYSIYKRIKFPLRVLRKLKRRNISV